MKKELKHAHYIEKLARAIDEALPYWEDSDARLRGERSKRNLFPKGPGVYVILRRVNVRGGRRVQEANAVSPLVLYVGKTTSRRAVKDRLSDHFGGGKPNYGGSQFTKFLFQLCQDDESVQRILWSKDMLIAAVEIKEGDPVIDAVERLAMQVFKPRFNVKDR